MPATLVPPAGWLIEGNEIARDPEFTITRETVEGWYVGLKDWAKENGKNLTPVNYSLIQYDTYLDIYAWSCFTISADGGTNTVDALIGEFPCTGCGETLAIGQVYCAPCERFIVCETCRLGGLRLWGMRGQTSAGVCTACSVECETATCVNRMSRADGYAQCPTCDPRGACGRCNTVVPLAQLVEHGTTLVCPACLVFVCHECDQLDETVQDRDLAGTRLHICQKCVQGHYDRERAKFEAWSADELPISGSLLIPGTASRPIRTVSIETEFDGNGVDVGRALCSAGLLPEPDRGRYREQGEAQGRYPCLLKSDASVTGGELVTYLLDLDTDNHAAALMRMTEVMKGCREMGLAQFTHRAGGHVHVDCHGLTARDLWAQYSVFNYLELAMFYIAGSGAEYGHRELSGSGYSQPGPKGPFNTIGAFAQKVLRRGERYALHFSNFAYAKEQCQCGAYIVGEWGDCTCNLGKATAEWRVFNAEITPRILHAWLALIQAITAYSTDLEGFDEANFPVLAWNSEPADKLSSTKKKAVKVRLEWMFENLPLTLHERDSVIYALKRSQLIVLGEDYLNSLIDITPANEFGAKKPAKNRSSRKEIAFALAGVAAGENARYVDDFYHGEDEDPEDDDDPGIDDGGW